MSKQKGLLIFVLFCLAALMVSCNQGSRPGDKTKGQPSEQKTTAVKAIDKGYVIQKEGNSWLVTAYMEKDGGPFIEAISFTVNEQTVLQDDSGEPVKPENVPAGTQVEAWHTGTVAESYPAQAVAAKMILKAPSEKAPEGMISQADALKIALQSRSGQTTGALAVKSAALDKEKAYWSVVLVSHEAVDRPVDIRIDARSGQVVPAPVAENDAFRVFSPEPGTEAGPGFKVEGEARVFEAAFSWTLEDGHHILAEGHETAKEGAPGWGRFSFDVSYEKASQPNMMLILFVHSAKDGSVQNQLIIPLKAPKERIQYKN
ncbi:Protein of unknown function [Paenibacillus sp. UNCCL117]|uniref:Gmad2 immunoglobulin-like domain-containing protein n=1 Tax=unclassified Paenibacillus TaxID=185978 RepID=UPI0008821F01|nr:MULTISPECIES: Gmad2 immunoglobulin-like domain-containing protein [unclassified Paenibacillus]SDD55350.1 Protein of unknown function [Paenibacillus sp. cl123]SFW51610.1 Protein of unknown function [Paenibacillus sp. UNCCL117]